MPDKEYQVIIGNTDFSDCVAMEGGYSWQVIAMSAESATGQDLQGRFHIPVLGERVQLAFTAPTVIPKARLYALAEALEFATTGQRACSVSYDDPCFGQITQEFYCTNIPWIKRKLPSGHYGEGVTFQLASTSFIKKPVAAGHAATSPQFAPDSEYKILIGGQDFSDCISMDEGFKGQIIAQSLQSQTGMLLDGKFEIPIIGERSQIEVKCITAIEVPRFRQLCAALQFGTTGERAHSVTYEDMVRGQTTQNYYCTNIKGERMKLPEAPYHYMTNVSFTMAMKQFF
jgi:hypothetical protein